jgi:hypothetical protein
MPGFTVYGADGRRVVRGFADSAAHELAARINASSGETLTVVEDGVAFEAAPAEAAQGKRPLEDLSGKELKQLADELGVTFAKRANRAAKIAALREALPAAEESAAESEPDDPAADSTEEPAEGAED